MSGVCRKGDVGTGHGGWPSRPNDQGSPNVFVNGIEWHRQGDHWVTHCDSNPSCHDSVLQNGDPTVFVNGKEAGRIGDPIACGSYVLTGSADVFSGGS